MNNPFSDLTDYKDDRAKKKKLFAPPWRHPLYQLLLRYLNTDAQGLNKWGKQRMLS